MTVKKHTSLKIKAMTKSIFIHLILVGLMSSVVDLKAQTLIAHFPLDSDGNSTEEGGFTASTETDVEFGSEGANAKTGTSATFNGASSIIQHDWSADLNPESFTLPCGPDQRVARGHGIRRLPVGTTLIPTARGT